MNREQTIKTALGQTAPDLVLRNCKIINVFTGEIVPGDIAVKDGIIAGVGHYTAENEIDLKGRYVSPGLIDAHLHVESSMVTPATYCGLAVPWGTTTLITDPHEITNVLGAQGVAFMLEASESLPVNYYVQLPSCVPATPFEHAGDVFTAEKMEPLAAHPRVLGLGELMDYPGVAACDPEILKKLALFEGRVVDGHAPDITGNDLQAYVCSGVQTDHESTTYESAREKLRAGLAVLVREGTACKNLRPILEGVLRDKLPLDRLAFCTDDKHLADIEREGTIRYNVKFAIELGMDPVDAIRMATIHAARIYRLHHLGAVAPGYQADLLVLDDLQEMTVHSVYYKGTLVNKELFPTEPVTDPAIIKTVHLPNLSAFSFALKPRENGYPVIQIEPGNITTSKGWTTSISNTGQFADSSLAKIAVIERHHATGNIGVGLIDGYGAFDGAVATTVAHDSHNLIVAGQGDENMLVAAKEIARIQGGYVIVKEGKVVDSLPLPVAGLMSDLPAEQFTAMLDAMIEKAHALGVPRTIDPFLTLSFMALVVIPKIRITDMGMFDVEAFRFY